MRRTILVVIMITLWTLPAGTRAIASPAHVDDESDWYGGAIVAADGISLGVLGLGTIAGSSFLLLGGETTYLFAGPIRHASRGNWGRGGASFALRVVIPAVGVLAAPLAHCDDDEECWDARVVGFGLGALVASTIDWSLLARDPGPTQQSGRYTGFAPTLSLDRSGALALGLSGQF